MSAAGCAQTALAIMPLPASSQAGTGEFAIDSSFSVRIEGFTEPRLERAKHRFLKTLSSETGIPLLVPSPGSVPKFVIRAKAASAPVQQVGEDESYRLEVGSGAVVLSAANPLGVLHGLQTFLQLVRVTPQGFSASAVTIEDRPRFPWRGLMLDSGRHFMPLEVVYRTLDGMEAVKLNVFHWHLSEDQGFRVESKRYPLLTERGSDGLFYTQAQIREVIGYARDRGIRVVPEFDMPGHASSWFVGYPELASGKGPYHIERKWGVFDPAMDPTRETTYQFVDGLIAEMAALFPDAYFHVGGDESNGKEWSANPRIQDYMRSHQIKDNAALQAYFTNRVQTIVMHRGKIMLGWDEVLQPTTPKDVVIQSWRGQESLGAAARQGNRGLLSNGYYIDLNQPASEHYLVDPLDIPAKDGVAALTPEQEALILGGEATMWSEFVTPENVDSRIWPRTAAIAERFWSPREARDVSSMYLRMASVSQKLEYYGLKHRSSTELMLQRMTGYYAIPVPLQVLARVVEPPKGYTREDLRAYDSFSPLNRLVDAVPPESDTARQFVDIARKVVAGKATTQEIEEAATWLGSLRDNDALLAPWLVRSELTSDLAPLSLNVSQVATIGLHALQALRDRKTVSPAEQQRQVDFLKLSEEPQAELLNKVTAGVRVLVEGVPVDQ